jgi:hypothetical protein
MIDGTPTAGEVPTSTSYTEMRDESCLVGYGNRLRDFKILQEIDKASPHQDIAPWLLELKPLLQPSSVAIRTHPSAAWPKE